MSSRAPWLLYLRLAAAGTAGYALIVLLTSLGFGALGNPGFYHAGWVLQAKGFSVSLLSGVAGGGVAALLGGARPFRHALAVVPWLVIDSTYVLFFSQRKDPFWFDLLGALGLIGATLAGGLLVKGLVARPRARG
jgi:hypothetical protein